MELNGHSVDLNNLKPKRPMPPQLVDIRDTAKALNTTVSELGKRGAAAADPKMQSVAARLRQLRERGMMNDADAERLYKMMTDHKYAALDVLETLKIMRDIAIKSNNIAQINLYTQRINDWSKLYHGEKIKVESTSVNVNINATLEEWERRLYDKPNEDTV